MHSTTPFEVKRLEYELRLDAAAKCPGTVERIDEPDEPLHEDGFVTRFITQVSAFPATLSTMARTFKRARAH